MAFKFNETFSSFEEAGATASSSTYKHTGGNYTSESKPFENNAPPGWKLFIMYTITLLIIAVNIPIFIIVPRRVPCLQRSMRYTMISLAVSDILLGMKSLIRLAVVLPIHGYTLDDGSFHCKWDGFFNNLLASVSILCLTWLSVDKLLIVKYPIRHKYLITKRRIIIILLAIWFSMVVLYIPTITALGDGNYDISSYICIGVATGIIHAFVIVILVQVIPSITIILCFVIIYITIKKSQRFRRKASTVAYSTPNGGQFQKENIQMFKTLFIMSSGYYIMWMPFFIAVPYWELISGQSLHPMANFVTCWLGAANSMLNPLVYIPTLKPYREVLYKLCRFRTMPAASLAENGSDPTNRGVIVHYSQVDGGSELFSSNSK